MGQGHQLDAGRRDGHRAIAQQAVQEESHVIFRSVGAVDVQGLEHRVREALQSIAPLSHTLKMLHAVCQAMAASLVSSSTGHTRYMPTQGGEAHQKGSSIEQEAKAATVQELHAILGRPSLAAL